MEDQKHLRLYIREPGLMAGTGLFLAYPAVQRPPPDPDDSGFIRRHYIICPNLADASRTADNDIYASIAVRNTFRRPALDRKQLRPVPFLMSAHPCFTRTVAGQAEYVFCGENPRLQDRPDGCASSDVLLRETRRNRAHWNERDAPHHIG